MNRDEILKMEAGTKMNQYIWWKIFDMEPTPPNNDMLLLSDYSGNIAAAWKVVEKLNQKGMCVLVSELVPYRQFEENLSGCEITPLSDDEESEPETIKASADTAPLAICRAALLAVMEAK
jgi:hypothetical protein